MAAQVLTSLLHHIFTSLSGLGEQTRTLQQHLYSYGLFRWFACRKRGGAKSDKQQNVIFALQQLQPVGERARWNNPPDPKTCYYL